MDFHKEVFAKNGVCQYKVKSYWVERHKRFEEPDISTFRVEDYASLEKEVTER